MFVDIVAGYLGAGKTTTLLAFIARDPDPTGLVALVNEFGDVGIDGDVLQGSGSRVVELPSGCICCTLRLDFRAQIAEIARDLAPRRLLVEPTGVATVSQVIRALRHPSLAEVVEGARVFVVVDATAFNERMRASPAFFTSQLAVADVVLLNKTDLVEGKMVPVLIAAVESLAPRAWVVPTVGGDLGADVSLPAPHPLEEPGDAVVIDDLASLAFGMQEPVEAAALELLVDELAAGRYGAVERAKGLVETESGWTYVDVAAGRVESRPAGPTPEGRLVVIGRGLDRKALAAALRGLSGGRTEGGEG